MIKKKSKKRGWFKNGGEAKRGYYQGIWVDSSWELAFLIYHLDKGHEIMRNTKNFPYKWRQGTQYYRPDFIVDGQYVEIKGYLDYRSKKKMEWFIYPLELVGKKEIQKYLDYARAKFGDDFAKQLLIQGEK